MKLLKTFVISLLVSSIAFAQFVPSIGVSSTPSPLTAGQTVDVAVSGWQFVYSEPFFWTGSSWASAGAFTGGTAQGGWMIAPQGGSVDFTFPGVSQDMVFAIFACNQLSALVYDCNGLVTLDANNQVVANNAKWMLYTVHTGPAQACAPSTETCNGLDDDCDGQVDESLSTTSPCSAGVGACARTGTTTTACSNGAMATIACSATAGTPTTEVCGNGVDEDCNGADLACSSPAPSPAPVAPVPTVGISRMTDAGGQTNPPSPWKPKQAFFCNQGEVACGGVAISLFSTQVGELKCCPVVDFTIGNEVAAIGPLGPGSDLICPVDTAACGYGGQLSPTKYVDMVRCCEVSGASVDVSNPQLLSLKNSNPGGKLPNPVSCAANEVVCGTRNDQKNYAEDAYCCSIK